MPESPLYDYMQRAFIINICLYGKFSSNILKRLIYG